MRKLKGFLVLMVCLVLGMGTVVSAAESTPETKDGFTVIKDKTDPQCVFWVHWKYNQGNTFTIVDFNQIANDLLETDCDFDDVKSIQDAEADRYMYVDFAQFYNLISKGKDQLEVASYYKDEKTKLTGFEGVTNFACLEGMFLGEDMDKGTAGNISGVKGLFDVLGISTEGITNLDTTGIYYFEDSSFWNNLGSMFPQLKSLTIGDKLYSAVGTVESVKLPKSVTRVRTALYQEGAVSGGQGIGTVIFNLDGGSDSFWHAAVQNEGGEVQDYVRDCTNSTLFAVNATWVKCPREVKVNFYAEKGGKVDKTITVDNTKGLTDMPKYNGVGGEQKGFVDDKGGAYPDGIPAYQTAKELNLYANYDAFEYTIKYVSITETKSKAKLPEDTTYENTQGAIAIPDGSASFYEFDGWYLDEECTGKSYKQLSNDLLKDAGSMEITLYCKFTPVELETTVACVISGGEAYEGTVVDSPLKYDIEHEPELKYLPIEVEDLEFENDGFSYKGVYSDEECKKPVKGLFSTDYDKNYSEIYARYTPKKFILAIDSNGGNIQTSARSIAYGTYFTVSNAVSQPGYEFLGWYVGDKELDSTAEKYLFDYDKNITVTAKWKKIVEEEKVEEPEEEMARPHEYTKIFPVIDDTVNSRYVQLYDIKQLIAKNTVFTLDERTLIYKIANSLEYYNGYVDTVEFMDVINARADISEAAKAECQLICTTVMNDLEYAESKLPRVLLSKAKSKKKKQLEVKFKSYKNVSYEIQVSTNKKFKKAKTYKTKKNKYTIKKLKRKTTYYVRVRSCKTIAGVVHHGKWSVVKKAKIK